MCQYNYILHVRTCTETRKRARVDTSTEFSSHWNRTNPRFKLFRGRKYWFILLNSSTVPYFRCLTYFSVSGRVRCWLCACAATSTDISSLSNRKIPDSSLLMTKISINIPIKSVSGLHLAFGRLFYVGLWFFACAGACTDINSLYKWTNPRCKSSFMMKIRYKRYLRACCEFALFQSSRDSPYWKHKKFCHSCCLTDFEDTYPSYM